MAKRLTSCFAGSEPFVQSTQLDLDNSGWYNAAQKWARPTENGRANCKFWNSASGICQVFLHKLKGRRIGKRLIWLIKRILIKQPSNLLTALFQHPHLVSKFLVKRLQHLPQAMLMIWITKHNLDLFE